MTRRLLLSCLSLAIVVLAMLEVPLGFINARGERAQLTAKVERDAVTIASLAESTVEGDAPATNLAAIEALSRRYAADTGARVVITNRQGVALADSAPPAPGRRTFATRPEFRAALRGDVATGTRHSSTLGYDLLYVAVPIASGGTVLGAVRITYPTSELDRRVRNYWLVLAGIAVVVLAAAALIGLSFARWIRRPLAGVEVAAADAGAGISRRGLRCPMGRPSCGGSPWSSTTWWRASTASSPCRRSSSRTRHMSFARRSRLCGYGSRTSSATSAPTVARASRPPRRRSTASRASSTSCSPWPEPMLARRPPRPWTSSRRRRPESTPGVRPPREVRLQLEGSGPVRARVGPDRVAQVIDNLVSNALRHAPAGSVVRVSVTRPTAGLAELRVADEGPGMTAEQKARAFDRFWRAGTGSGGSGLGLAIARRLVEVDGGTIDLDDATGGGLVAVVRLPAA